MISRAVDPVVEVLRQIIDRVLRSVADLLAGLAERPVGMTDRDPVDAVVATARTTVLVEPETTEEGCGTEMRAAFLADRVKFNHRGKSSKARSLACLNCTPRDMDFCVTQSETTLQRIRIHSYPARR